MDKELEILRGNVIIREFMNEPQPPIRCEYHRSWDWLMSVVEKIEDMEEGGTVDIFMSYCTISEENTTTIAIRDAASKIEAVWRAITEFINRYNQQNPKP